MKGKTSAIAVLMVVFLAGGFGLWAESGLRPWDHATNPAFLSFGSRTVVELGTSMHSGFANSAFGLSDLLTRVLVIDLNDMYAKIPDDGLRLATAAEAETHLAVQLGRLGLGFFADMHDVSRAVIPRTFVGLLAEGNELDQVYSGSTEILQRAFVRAGTVASFEILGFVIAGKFSAFAPAAYSDSNAQATFLLETAADGTVSGEVAAAGDVYTSFGDEGLQGYGFNVSLGVVRPDGKGKPRYGGALNNIPLVAARPGYLIEMEQFRYEFEALDLLDRLNQGLDPFSTQTQGGDVELIPLDPGERPKIHMPFSLSGFYRLSIPVIDIIPSAELVLEAPVRLNANLAVEGSLFPANLLSIGFGWRDYLWQASLGLRIPLRVFELAIQVASVGTEFAGVFDGRGLGATVALAVGY